NSSSLAAGVYDGTVTITALASANASNSPQVLPVTLVVGQPLVFQNGVVNAASFSRAAVVSPGSIVALFGANLSAGADVASILPLPRMLAGTQVLVNNVPAPLFFVSPDQINFQVPPGAAPPSVSVNVVSGGVRGPAATIHIAPQEPGIFTIPAGGSGPAAVVNQDATINSVENPAPPGSVIAIYATGLGATNPPVAAGEPGALEPPFNVTVLSPRVIIGEIGEAPAELFFSGMAPGFAGLYQVNARVPFTTQPGNAVRLRIEIGGRTSNVVTIAVR
ncbi:MAG: IPT/TIG domain-containing protein, partial [Gemmatimonadales bacterium]